MKAGDKAILREVAKNFRELAWLSASPRYRVSYSLEVV